MESTLTEPKQDPKRRPAVPSYSQIIKILNLIRAEVDVAEIGEELKADPVISYRLMMHVNSAGMGFPKQIRSYKQAITILGYHQLYRWLTMLLVTADPGEGHSAVGRNAIIRGRFLELVGKTHFKKAQSDDLFVVGAFSLLDALLGEPMEKLLDGLNISDAMRTALLKREGPYAALLLLAEAIERAEEATIDRLQSGLGIPIDVIYDTYSSALEWVEKLSV